MELKIEESIAEALASPTTKLILQNQCYVFSEGLFQHTLGLLPQHTQGSFHRNNPSFSFISYFLKGLAKHTLGLLPQHTLEASTVSPSFFLIIQNVR